jgi:MYXO-CTERM domain-containing protein
MLGALRRNLMRYASLVVAPFIGSLIAILAFPKTAEAAQYQVGPGKAFATLQSVAPKLAPGDVVEVDGGVTYPGDIKFASSGTAAAKITLIGKRSASGARPVLAGGTNTVHFQADHYVMRGFEITGGDSRCVFHQGDDITLEDSVVHDCPKHGILGADEESGSLTLSYVEVYACGSGDSRHPIYIATDEENHPGSVFRMEHCYVHDGNGGNNVKSRAQRNEIRYNWIEGALYHEIELIGPDGAEEDLFREDSDVVGNVFRKTGNHYMARFGGDGTGQTNGRYRFFGNTVILAPGSSAVFRLYDGIESVEMHDNVFYRAGGGGVQVIRDSDASWTTGHAVIAGSHNWVAAGSTEVPSSWTATLTGADPGFVAASARDFRPTAGSPLRGQGIINPASAPGFAFPSPLAAALSQPPLHRIEALGAALPRLAMGAVDIGAFAYGTAGMAAASSSSVDSAAASLGGASEGAPLAAGDDGSSVSSGSDASSASGGCSVGAGAPQLPLGALALAAVGLLRWSRRRGNR